MELSAVNMDTTRTGEASAQYGRTDVNGGLPELPGQWIPTARGRFRARISGCSKHPIAWMHSALTRRRGLRAQAPVGADEILVRLSELPLSLWTYGFDHSSVRHLGPMAQDFAAAFGLGYSKRRIAVVDANGVCMAAIQALYGRVVILEEALDEARGVDIESAS
ncbi:tail fiber domain-containing protein [Rhodococcus zopfii]|uniref:tail fiber domain-containing protein n=1 Tax=Rhodococcus zopfii TaxID=43772 RepID=UPI001F10FC29|nr:tail fiber domain-containing protein [Rhodococcus zopfii]